MRLSTAKIDALLAQADADYLWSAQIVEQLVSQRAFPPEVLEAVRSLGSSHQCLMTVVRDQLQDRRPRRTAGTGRV